MLRSGRGALPPGPRPAPRPPAAPETPLRLGAPAPCAARRHPASFRPERQVCRAGGVVVGEEAGAAFDIDMTPELTLESIRMALIRQEDTILFNLIERSQFARNDAVYTSGAVLVPGFSKADGSRYSMLEYFLRETEQLHGKIRRYSSPDEHPFYPDDVPALVLAPLTYKEIFPPSVKAININSKIMRLYLDNMLKEITIEGDDGNYGSAAVLDVMCLQALSKRIHYGKFVAEAKFREQPEVYTALIKAQDAEGILQQLTNQAVEDSVVERVKLKAATYGQHLTRNGVEPTNGKWAFKVPPDAVAEMYTSWVMPLTKEVQVECLLRRFDDQGS
eukprot:evm.model.scf_1505.2 EVM.evm.TU.scf_1505.2   scf_1505:7802-11239(+)